MLFLLLVFTLLMHLQIGLLFPDLSHARHRRFLERVTGASSQPMIVGTKILLSPPPGRDLSTQQPGTRALAR